ncbi:MAG TPA: hypothetical protein VGO76_01445 [Luteibacter sp.]|nr:hypothetical protein [Luteibacter sp.]
MSATWFLEQLDLPAWADARSVRRAYAARLKAIDHEADPAGFASLRRAYEAALAWVEHEADANDATVADASAAAAPTAEEQAAMVSHIAEAALLIEAFVAALPATPDRDLPALLERTTASLRQAYVDAPSVFEDRLIDVLMDGSVQRRASLFFAAVDHFRWNELGRLKELGERGAWVDAVLVQRLTWDGRAAIQRGAWTTLLVQANRRPMPAELVPQWTTAEFLLQTFPAYASLFLDTGAITEWKERFAQLPDAQRRRKKGMPLYLVVLLLVAAFPVGRLLLPDHPVATSPVHAPPQSRTLKLDCPTALRYLRGGSAPVALGDAVMRRSVLLVSGGCMRSGEWPDDLTVRTALQRLQAEP